MAQIYNRDWNIERLRKEIEGPKNIVKEPIEKRIVKRYINGQKIIDRDPPAKKEELWKRKS